MLVRSQLPSSNCAWTLKAKELSKLGFAPPAGVRGKGKT